MNETHFTEADRKLLIQLEERQKQTTDALASIQKKLDEDVFVKKVDADKKFDDIEKRMRWVERIAYTGIVLLAVAEFVIRFII